MNATDSEIGSFIEMTQGGAGTQATFAPPVPQENPPAAKAAQQQPAAPQQPAPPAAAPQKPITGNGLLPPLVPGGSVSVTSLGATPNSPPSTGQTTFQTQPPKPAGPLVHDVLKASGTPAGHVPPQQQLTPGQAADITQAFAEQQNGTMAALPHMDPDDPMVPGAGEVVEEGDFEYDDAPSQIAELARRQATQAVAKQEDQRATTAIQQVAGTPLRTPGGTVPPAPTAGNLPDRPLFEPQAVTVGNGTESVADTDGTLKRVARDIKQLRLAIGLALLDDPDAYDPANAVHVALHTIRWNTEGLFEMTPHDLCKIEVLLAGHHVYMQGLEKEWAAHNRTYTEELEKCLRNARDGYPGGTKQEKEDAAVLADKNLSNLRLQTVRARAIATVLEGAGEAFSQYENSLKRAISLSIHEYTQNPNRRVS
jgi:hypothetical protein